MNNKLANAWQVFSKRNVRGFLAVGRVLLKGLTDSEYRNYLQLRYFKTNEVMQPKNTTSLNRYPEIFGAVQKLLADRKNCRILSFGCSTGEEVITLRTFFPDAEIVGCDINKYSLSICRNQIQDGNTSFIYSSKDKLIEAGPFDAIFCMAVFRTTVGCDSDETSIADAFPFERFEKNVRILDSILSINGLLTIYFANYRFFDVDVSSRYEVASLDTAFAQADRVVPKFDNQSKLLGDNSYMDIIFRKLSN